MTMRLKKWTVARFQDGTWSTGGSPDDPDYANCEVFVVSAASRETAKKKAQQQRYRKNKKEVLA